MSNNFLDEIIVLSMTLNRSVGRLAPRIWPLELNFSDQVCQQNHQQPKNRRARPGYLLMNSDDDGPLSSSDVICAFFFSEWIGCGLFPDNTLTFDKVIEFVHYCWWTAACSES